MAASAYSKTDKDTGLHKIERIEQYLANDLPTGLTSATSITLTALTGILGVGGYQAAGGVGGAVYLAEAATPPTGSVTSGGIIFVKNGSLCFIGTTGTLRVLAAP